MIVPVANIQVGCVAAAVGCAGVAGGALIVTLRAGDIQAALYLTVTLYVLGTRPVKMPVVFV